MAKQVAPAGSQSQVPRGFGHMRPYAGRCADSLSTATFRRLGWEPL